MAENISSQQQSRAGFVAVVGPTNAGKSTLVNFLVGAKVAIVTPKVQTTVDRILGIYTQDSTQVILMDTPGLFQPKGRGRALIESAYTGAREARRVLLVVDARFGLPPQLEEHIKELVKIVPRHISVALNKIDLVEKPVLLDLAARFNNEWGVQDISMISARTGAGCADLKAHLASLMEPGPWLYPEDQLSDKNDRFLAEEITREQLLLRLHQEIPYNLWVETVSYKEQADGSVQIHQDIHVTRSGHRPIIVGKGGRTIKMIGIAARRQLENLLDCPVHLRLNVKVSSRHHLDANQLLSSGESS